MPFVVSYEQENVEFNGNRWQSVLKNKKDNDPKQILKKE